ncbi:transmembrane protein 50 homolog [Lolium rigidum]|uniref:transmembrane protein 50 homolog n=1 Tax=Lolium rigidum TaxID=89674 RepID=UPI001F5C730A|nr:transmembrane protein 50 homolog [Lolium rigidum]
MENLAMLWAIIGPGVAGALFGAGWWFWVDAVVCSAVKVSFIHYLPGIFASVSALMFNCVSKEDLGGDYYSAYGGGDDNEWRSVFLLDLALIGRIDLWI